MRKKLTPIFIAMIAVVLTGCLGGVGKRETGEVLSISLKAEPAEVLIGGEVLLTATVKGPNPDGATVVWTSDSGHLSSETGASVRWTASQQPGAHDIVATVTPVGKKPAVGKVRVIVVAADGGSDNDRDGTDNNADVDDTGGDGNEDGSDGNGYEDDGRTEGDGNPGGDERDDTDKYGDTDDGENENEGDDSGNGDDAPGSDDAEGEDGGGIDPDDDDQGDTGDGDEGDRDDDGELSVDVATFYEYGVKWEYKDPDYEGQKYNSYYSIEVIDSVMLDGELAHQVEYRYFEDGSGLVEYQYLVITEDEIIIPGGGSTSGIVGNGPPSETEHTNDPPVRRPKVLRAGMVYENDYDIVTTSYVYENGERVERGTVRSTRFFEKIEVYEVAREPISLMGRTFHDAIRVVYRQTTELNGNYFRTGLNADWYVPGLGIVKMTALDEDDWSHLGTGFELVSISMP